MKKDVAPIYHGKRNFLGLKDLVVSLYTQRCQFGCSYCELPYKSSERPVSMENTLKQVHWVFDQYEDEIETFRQLSVGNEGSILDTKRFPKEAMNYLLARAREIPHLEVLSLETRPEYADSKYLGEIMKSTHAKKLDVTTGFETLDDSLRNSILKKRIERGYFEKKVKMLGEMGIRLTSYVMLKPGPSMTDEEGVAEAVSTINYLNDLCKRDNVELVIYINPTYVPKNAPISKEMRDAGYKPPTIQSVMRTIAATLSLKVPIYTGLWSENMADEKGDFTGLEGYDKKFRNAIKQFNKTQDPSIIAAYMSK